MRKILRTCRRPAFGLLFLFVASAALAAPLPRNPSLLKFPPLTFEPPDPAQYRVVLENGMVVYVNEDRSLPQVQLSASWPSGSFYDPPGKEGLAGLTYRVMRTGGTERMTGDELDARLEQLAASVSTSAGGRTASGACWCLAKDTDEVLQLFADIVIRPRFAEDKLRLARDETLQSLRHRYDSPSGLLATRTGPLLYGETPPGRVVTGTSVKSITRDDLVAFHRRFLAPNHMIVAVSGSLDRAALLDTLRHLFADVAPADVPALPRDTRVDLPGAAPPGVYLLNKPGPQAFVRVGHLGIERHDPDYLPLQTMNYILGGAFTSSRIPKRVRSDEGLSYAVGSRVEAPVGYAGAIGVALGCASENVAYAVSLVRGECERIGKEPVTDEELQLAKDAVLGAFPDWFSTPFETLTNYAGLERDELPRDYFHTYRQQVSAITKEDVLRVAHEHLRPERFRVFVAGDAQRIQAGNASHPTKLSDLGPVQVIEPGDPMEAK